MRLSLFGLLFAVLTAPATAQQARHDVTGTVRGGDGVAVVGARVVLMGSRRSALTDDRGRFRLPDLRPGTYRLHVSSLGYAPVTREVEVPRTTATPLEITLRQTPLDLPGLEVTAKPGGGDVRAVAQATTQMNGRELARNTGATLAQTLESEPGIGVRYNGPAAAAPVIRGLSGDRILILQDGQRTGDLAGSAVDHTVTADPLSASRIEVVRGPAALLYGNNALGGVVNVVSGDIPRNTPPSASGTVVGQLESAYAGGGVSARSTVPLTPRWAATVRAGLRRTGDVRIARDPALGDRLDNTHLRSRHAVLGLGYAGDGATVGGAVRAFDFRYGLPVRPGEEAMAWDGRRVEAAVRADVELPGTILTDARLDLSTQDYAHDERPVEDPSAGNHFELLTHTLNLVVTQAPAGPLGRGAWGVSGLVKDYRSTGESSLTPPAASRALGLFVFQETEPVGPVTLQAGARFDRYAIRSRTAPRFGPGRERVFHAVSGSLGAVAPVGDWATASLTVARAFRAPTVEELFSSSVHAGTGAVEFGNPDLRAETSIGLDAVLRVHTPRLNGQIAAYRNAVAGYVYPTVRGDTVVYGHTLPVVSYTQEDAVLTGLEGSMELLLTDRLVAGVGGDVIRADRAGGAPLPYLPPARLSASLRWDDGTWLLGAGIRHAAARSRISEGDETPTDAYTLLDLEAGVRRTIGGLTHTVTLRVDNATDVLYRDAASRIKDFAPNPGRNVVLHYRVRF